MQQFRINIDFTGTPDKVYVALIEDAVEAVLAAENSPNPVSINLLISDDQHLQQLNRKYLGFDRPTDVLAFPMDEPVDGLDGHLGDIAISMDAAGRQAEEAGHSVESELQLLLVHGILHLLGYDHHTEEDKKVMWTVQANVLNQLDQAINVPD